MTEPADSSLPTVTTTDLPGPPSGWAWNSYQAPKPPTTTTRAATTQDDHPAALAPPVPSARAAGPGPRGAARIGISPVVAHAARPARVEPRLEQHRGGGAVDDRAGRLPPPSGGRQ